MSQKLRSGRALVRVRGELQNFTLHEVAVDPFLLIQTRTDLQLSRLVDKDEALNCLGHLILGKPDDLRAHVQRILLLIESGNRPGLYSALLDLMIALGTNGRSLRQRILSAAQPLLAPATAKYFQDHLDSGVGADDPQVVRAKGALLRMPRVAGALLVKRSENAKSRPVSVMEQANSFLEYGQLEQAVELLEKALLQDPDQNSEAELLLGLYRTLHEEARWQGMREQLLLSFNRLPSAWSNAPEYF